MYALIHYSLWAKEMLTGGESRAFELLGMHKWQRQIGPKCIGSSLRALASWQLPKLLRARSSE
jgi:hypothetical protein